MSNKTFTFYTVNYENNMNTIQNYTQNRDKKITNK